MRERRGLIPADAWCWMYFAASPFVAGAIVWFSVGSTTSGGDYCDPIYGSAVERDADYHVASRLMDISSLVMLAIGVVALVVLLTRRHALQRWRGLRVASGIAVAAMAMGGYLFLLLIASDFSSDCGGIRL